MDRDEARCNRRLPTKSQAASGPGEFWLIRRALSGPPSFAVAQQPAMTMRCNTHHAMHSTMHQIQHTTKARATETDHHPRYYYVISNYVIGDPRGVRREA